MSLPGYPIADPTGRSKAHWATRWKLALNAFAITFDGPDHPDRQLTNAKVGSTVNQTRPRPPAVPKALDEQLPSTQW
jgi:hypothetical protein